MANGSVSDDIGHRFSTPQYYVINTVTLIGIFVSIVFICIHLVVHLLANKLHNLPGHNLASFCVSLLMEYSSILLSVVLEDYFCTEITATVNYFVLTSYMWMLIMSYETWSTIRTSMRQCALSTGNRWKRFYIYSACCWLIPALFLALDYVVPQFNAKYAVITDDKTCPRSDPLLTMIKECVLLVILFSNSLFFGSSLYYLSNHSVRNLNTTDSGFAKRFSLYMRLVLITGFTWTLEELAFYSGWDVLSLAFQTINMFEGLFIAVAFTCRKQVLDSVRFLKCI
ncbi:G-protein coupled receptor Mth2-like [Planococcus citri]|uniref:G-protein coupled receptor Mth2-like n=1 Tax=Planococcus citri TaxID=170843 RepID=UPI0031F9FAF1